MIDKENTDYEDIVTACEYSEVSGADGIKKSYNDTFRDNLPRKVTSDFFYNGVIDDFNESSFPNLIVILLMIYKENKRKTRIIRKGEINGKIVGVNTDFTVNKYQQYTDNPLVSNNCSIHLGICQMNLERQTESIEFIKKYIDFFDIKIPAKISVEAICNSLVHLDFLTVDAYLLAYILNKYDSGIVNNKDDIEKLYFSVCADFLFDFKLLVEAVGIVHEFKFGQMNGVDKKPYFDLEWLPVRMHRSVLGYLIARCCAKELRKLNFKDNNLEQNEKSKAIFSMVLPESITRFVVKLLQSDEKVQHRIMIFAEQYDELSINAETSLVFWLICLKNSIRRVKAKTFLRIFFQKEKKIYSLNKSDNFAEKRDAPFLLRSICVSYMYETDKKVLSYYMNSLLNDKVYNSVNRGFHLEYYGDKSYLTNHSLLDYEDELTKGETKLTAPCSSLDKKCKRQQTNFNVAILKIMILCNLIQARMEYYEGVEPLDATPYIVLFNGLSFRQVYKNTFLM